MDIAATRSASSTATFGPPEASPSGTGVTLPSDLSAALLSLILQSRGAQTEASEAEIEHANQLLEQARRQIEEAMSRAEEAQENSGFWGAIASVFGGDVAAILGAIAAAALIVATGGTGAVAVIAIAAAGLSAGSTIGRECGLDPTVCNLLGAAGAIAGLATGNVAAASSTWQTVSTVASTAQSGAMAVSGGATIVEGQYEGDALDAQADTKKAEGREDDAWFRMDLAIGMLEQAARDIRQARSRVGGIQRTEHEGNTAVINQMGALS